ncbi:MAG TPA: hypothetical protein VIP51_04055 [Eoetvoesiella sp.]
MVNLTTAALPFRVDPRLKEALRTAAGQEHHPIANMVEVLVRNHCEQHRIAIPPFEETKDSDGARS